MHDSSTARLVSIQVGTPRVLRGACDPDPLISDDPSLNGSAASERWRSGFLKQTIQAPCAVGLTNLAGDGQADLSVHGGPDKAILCYPMAHWVHWRERYAWPDVGPGAFGENFSIGGWTEGNVCLGDVWSVGTVRLQVSQPRQPCWKLGRRWARPELPKLVIQTGWTGWYLRVLQTGTVEPGQPIERIACLYPQWTITRLNACRYNQSGSEDDLQFLAACAELASSWRDTFARRLEASRNA